MVLNKFTVMASQLDEVEDGELWKIILQDSKTGSSDHKDTDVQHTSEEFQYIFS